MPEPSRSAPAILVTAPRERMAVAAPVATFDGPTASRKRVTRGFRPGWGPAIYSEAAKSEGLLAIKLGAGDNSGRSEVKAMFSTGEKPAWVPTDPAQRPFATQT